MKFYDRNGGIHDNLTSVMVASIGSKILQKIDNGGGEETAPINMPGNTSDSSNPIFIPTGKFIFPEEGIVISINDNTDKAEPFNFGSIEIDWDERKINLVDSDGNIRQSSSISEDLISSIGDIDPNSIPDPNSTELLDINGLIDQFVLGKDDSTVLSILDKMTKGKIEGERFGGTVTENISDLTNDITNKILRDYDVTLPGGTKQGLVQTVINFLTNRLQYLYKDV